MKYKYHLPEELIEKVSYMREFANGAAQVTVITKDGKKHRNVLISNSTFIIAMRGHKDLPFDVADIDDIYQSDNDKNPKLRGGWDFWDQQ